MGGGGGGGGISGFPLALYSSLWVLIRVTGFCTNHVTDSEAFGGNYVVWKFMLGAVRCFGPHKP